MAQSLKMYQLSCAPFLFLAVFLICSGNAENSTNETAVLKVGEKKISEYIVAVLEHFKQKDPVGIPGAPIPDPMDIPPFKHSFSVGTLNCKNVKMHGLSKFRLDRVKTDVANMEVNAALTIDKLDVYGNYTLSSFFSSSKGPFTVNLKGVYAQTNATLEVMKEGHLEAQEMSMDITFKNMAMNFENLGFFASMFQSVINSVGNVMFDTIKPLILREMNTNMRNDINKQVKQVPLKFPNSISPFDQVVAEARKKVRNMGYDPYRVEDYNNSVGVFEVQMSNTWLYGISSFHRVGNITFLLVNNTVQADVKVGTQRLEGTSQWEISLAGMVSRAGSVSFSVEYLQVQVIVNQTTDTSNPPVLDDIQLELGNIQVRFDGAGTIDYLIEFGVNVIPNLLRYQIMDALENPIKMRAQEILNTVNIEKMVHENLPKIDEFEKKGIAHLLA